MPDRILITGGTGFIGQALVSAQKHQSIIAASRNGLWRDGEKLNSSSYDLVALEVWKELFERERPHVLVHLAWQGLPDYSLENSLWNLDLGIRLLRIAISSGVRRVVIAGTCWEYGDSQGCLREDSEPQEPSVFAAHKLAQYQIASAMCRVSGVELAWARIFFCYGPNQRPQSLIPTVVASLRDRKQPNLKTPEALIDLIHVSDVSRALLALTNIGAPTGVFNVGSGQAVPTFLVAQKVAELMQSQLTIPSEVNTHGFWADTTRLKTEFDFQPTFTLEEGIRQTVDWLLAKSQW